MNVRLQATGIKKEGFMKAEFTTRLEADLRRRLRVFAAVSERTIEDIVGSALDGYLPPAAEMAALPATAEPALAERSGAA
jgi:predicted transcriptional regulator